ncbi:MAG: protoporphyrinogen oxidase HemJ [Rhizobiaceae bacterium]|jgi:putative membrane protein|nr:protoporphyrinogen oxidase HemJ [Rhizobiaceae bacterium]
MYEWVKALHIISVISWMAGQLYLPRLLIYHFDAETGSVQSETFKLMERRLLRIIMTPAMLATWIFGLWLVVLIDAHQEGWFAAKFFLVILMSAFHGFQARWVREFREDKRLRSARFYRIANEGPTLLMIAIVILVVVKPF